MSFLITGEFVTRHARERVVEYGWEDAVRFLRNALPDLGEADAGRVLSGECCFTGDSRGDLDLAPEDEAVRAEVEAIERRLYAGIWFDRVGRTRRRPYARVTSFGPDDVVRQRVPNRRHIFPDCSMSRLTGGRPELWAAFRCVHYMDDPVLDTVLLDMTVPGVHGPQAVLWKACGPPPLWRREHASPQAALDEWVSVFGPLGERGAAPSSGGRRTDTLGRPVPGVPDEVVAEPPGPVSPKSATGTPATDPAVSSGPTPAGKADPMADLIRSLIPDGTPAHVAEALVRNHTDTGEYPDPQPAKDPAGVEWAWVGRDGRIWPCRGYMDHAALAQALVDKFGLVVPPEFRGSADRLLEERGWVKLGRDAGLEPWVFCSGRPTDAQSQAVIDWLAARGAGRAAIEKWATTGGGD